VIRAARIRRSIKQSGQQNNTREMKPFNRAAKTLDGAAPAGNN